MAHLAKDVWKIVNLIREALLIAGWSLPDDRVEWQRNLAARDNILCLKDYHELEVSESLRIWAAK